MGTVQSTWHKEHSVIAHAGVMGFAPAQPILRAEGSGLGRTRVTN
ncbi:MAG: hypothetical protein ABIG67_02825 [Pseudomonadota bacterium]